MKRAVIVCSLDGYANAVKPQKIKAHLQAKNYLVDIYATNFLSRFGEHGFRRLLPGMHPLQWALYTLEACHLLIKKMPWAGLRTRVLSRLTQPILHMRGRLLRRHLAPQKYDLLICENSQDQALIDGTPIAGKQILDLPSPLAEELYYGRDLHERAFRKLVEFEKSLYAQADALSFHWHTYASFVQQTKYQGDNFIDMGYGTEPKQLRASFREQPCFIFLGFLDGYWVNLPLLQNLSRIYPHIDVYGGPSDPGGVRYKGYAPNLDVLAKYQFGLITISDDPLRQHSFSSKQLEYYSYGLPVFTPDWRKDSLLDDGAILYNLDTFSALLDTYQTSKMWHVKQQSALRIAQELSWDRALKPLDNLS